MNVRLTIHAVDRASTRLLRHWKATRGAREGLAAWLRRLACAAAERERLLISDGNTVKAIIEGVSLVYAIRPGGPVLVTVKPHHKGRTKQTIAAMKELLAQEVYA